MSSTTFVDKSTVINTAWLNDVNGVVWTLFGGSSSASAARTALGLGTISTQAANNVAITGGTITGLGTPLPVASGGTASSTATGSGSVVLATAPTISGLTVSGTLTQSTSTGGDFITLASTSASTENAVRINATQTTSGVGLKLSNSGHNKQISIRGDSGGGLTVYVNQAAAGGTTSGTTAITVTNTGATTFASSVAATSVASTGAITENSTRVFSSNSAGKPANQAFNGVNKVFTFAHGLGAIPTFFMAYLKCIQVDNGYAVGDIIALPYSSVAGSGSNVFADATNVYVAVTGNISMVSKTGIGPSNLQSAGAFWEIYIRAWA